MSDRITLGSHSALEVEIDGEVYGVTAATLDVRTRAVKADENIRAATDPESYIAAMAKGLDVRLSASREGQPKASTVLAKMNRENRLTVAQVEALIEDISAR